MNKKITLFVVLFLGFLPKGISQEYLRENIIKLTEISMDINYGYTHEFPIKIGNVKMECHYLNALIGPNGEKVTWRPSGSCCQFSSSTAPYGKGFIDVYQVWYDGGKPKTLYLNGYEYEDLKCPVGFTFVIDNEYRPKKNPPLDKTCKKK